MRRSGNIFETENYRGTGIASHSPAAITTIILTALSVLAAILIVANYDEITALIAIGAANFLTSALPVVILILAVMYFLVRLKWKLFKWFW